MSDDLYGLPLQDFTAARNKRAAELKKAGDSDEAARVKASRKPSQAAWLINQLVRRKKKAAGDLLRAGERLREAQEKTLGGGGRGALEKAVSAEREAVERLVDAAREIAGESGMKLSGSNLARVGSTLHAVSLDEEVRERFEAGDLVSDHEATGIDVLALMAPPAQKKGGGRSGKSKKGDAAAARGRLRKAEAEEQRIEAELEAARRELNAAKERVKQTEGRLRRARKASDRLRGG